MVRSSGPGRAVITGEHDDGVVGQTVLFETVEDGAYFLVEVGDHRGIGGSRSWMRQVTTTEVGLLVPFSWIGIEFLDRNLECHMGDGAGVVEKKGPIRVFIDEGERFV